MERWSVLGQSFGGFCVVNYLSQAPDGLAEAFITGGLPPLDRHPDDVYRATYRADARPEPPLLRALPPGPGPRARDPRAARDRGRPPAERRPADAEALPPAGPPARNERRQREAPLHRRAAVRLAGVPARRRGRAHPSPRNPLYAVIHEACYANGAATRWSGERVFPPELRDDPTFLTGEHIFPGCSRTTARSSPLAEAAQILAEHEWPELYDAQRLAENDVPGGGGHLRRGSLRRARVLRADRRRRSAACGPG